MRLSFELCLVLCVGGAVAVAAVNDVPGGRVRGAKVPGRILPEDKDNSKDDNKQKDDNKGGGGGKPKASVFAEGGNYFGGDLMVTKSQIAEQWSPEVADLAEQLFVLAPEKQTALRVDARWEKDKADGRVHIPYTIDDAFTDTTYPSRDSLRAALDDLEDKTAQLLSFDPHTGGEDDDHIAFINDAGCYSFVGRIGGRQELSLEIGTSCGDQGVIQHEVMHALGFWHEHARPDRDDHIIVNFDNLPTDQSVLINFVIQQNAQSLGSPYDYGSIMHYPEDAFSINGEDTITVINGEDIGQRDAPSDADLVQMQLLYQCGEVRTLEDYTNERCTEDCPCGEGEGPCEDNDSYCRGDGLICGPEDTCIEIPIPENDQCSGAIEIPEGNPVKEGTTEYATADDGLETCEGNSQSDLLGVWYTFVGNGRNMTAETCLETDGAFDTQLTLYQGNCSYLECLDGNDDACARQSQITWYAEEDTVYYIYVHGFSDTTGNFKLGLYPEISDRCDEAYELDDFGTIFGSTHTATEIPGDDLTLCEGNDESSLKGSWYSIVGDGYNITASTCGDLTDFDTQVTVYSGTCDSLTCVGGDNDSCDLQSEFTWESELDMEYLIFVNGFKDSVGFFELEVSTSFSEAPSFAPTSSEIPTQEPSFDYCEAASPVELGFVYDQEGGEGFTSWYLVPGTGNEMRAVSCPAISYGEIESEIFVYQGNCKNLNFVTSSKDGCGKGATWESEGDLIYYVLVYVEWYVGFPWPGYLPADARGGDRGDGGEPVFKFSVTETNPTDPDP